MGQKGGAYERDVCKKLSLWWTAGADDFIFWRTSQSGGRATVRRRKGKKTSGHCGDVCAVAPAGEPLTRLITIEIKRGYSRESVGELFDKPTRLKQNQFEAFLAQTIRAAEGDETPYWMLIHRRDKREPFVFIPTPLSLKLISCGCRFLPPTLEASVRVDLGDREYRRVNFCGMTLEAFLESVDPEDIRILYRAVGGHRRKAS